MTIKIHERINKAIVDLVYNKDSNPKPLNTEYESLLTTMNKLARILIKKNV